MNKTDLVQEVSDRVDINPSEVELIIDEMLASMERELVKGNQVKLLGFGVFYKKERKARKGTNPSTHVGIEIPQNATVGFRPSKLIKAKLN